MNNFQRRNSISNAHVGKDFESLVFNILSKEYPDLQKNIGIEIGCNEKDKKLHKFDLGSIQQKVIVECKSHTWTASGKIPSAKMTTWDQALYYFRLAPVDLLKIFVVKKDLHPIRHESLCNYFLRTHSHLIPSNVEFRELDESREELNKIYPIRL